MKLFTVISIILGSILGGYIMLNVIRAGTGKTDKKVEDKANDAFLKQYKKLQAVLPIMSGAETKKLKESPENFRKEMQACFSVWKEKEDLRLKKERANIILERFYASGKIRDIFENFWKYVTKELEEEDSVEMLVASGYNSGMHFAYIDYKKMQEDLSGIQEDLIKKEDIKMLDGFLYGLAGKGSFFSNLYEVYMGQKRKAGKSIKETDTELCRMATAVNNKIANYSGEERDIRFSFIMEEMESQKENIQNDIEEAENIREFLSEIFTEEHMQLLKKKETDIAILKEEYRKVGALVERVLLCTEQ